MIAFNTNFATFSGFIGSARKVRGEPPCFASNSSIGVSTESGKIVETTILCFLSSRFKVKPNPLRANFVAV